MTPIDLALSYRDRGWPVFPCRAGEEHDPETGEIRDAKSPLTPRGLKDATTRQAIVSAWWERKYPSAMVGIPTGEAIGAWVLDIDVPPDHADGRAWLAEMEVKNGALPETLTATTPSGGTHYFWRHVDGVRNKAAIAPGVDTRGTGGYVIAPGSVMADGGIYSWDNNLPIAEAPAWLIDAVTKKAEQPKATSPSVAPASAPSRDLAPYVEHAVDAEMRELAETGRGSRGYQLNASAFSMGQLVGADVLSRDEAEDRLFGAAIANGLLETDGDREVRAKIRRGLEAGMNHPRDIPEPTFREDNTRLVDVKQMIATGLAKGGGAASIEWGSGKIDDTAPAGGEATDDSPIVLTPFAWVDPSTLPRREFAFGQHYIRKYVSVTVAPGGIGKTSNSIVEALAMASGKALNGVAPPQRLRVWLFNAEDPRDELDRRIMAACIHFGLTREDIDGYLFVDSGREQEVVVAIDDRRTGLKIQRPIVEAVVQQLAKNRIDVAIIDPFVSTHGVNENDNGAIDKVAKLWAQIANDANCAIDIVHHLRKVADREATVDDARGAVSLIGAARSVRVLNRMTEDQAKAASLSPDDRFGYFSITYGKANLTPLSHRADWRHIVSVGLGNGRQRHARGNVAMLKQDHAPVVTAWQLPTKADMIKGVPAEQIDLIKARAAGMSLTYNYQSKDWIGHQVADILQIDLPEGRAKSAEHARIERMIDAWIDDGVLMREDVKGTDLKHPDRLTTYVRAAA
ncbi:bifunctional DNA primase/polymerase [Consotaella salsifontis]|uniref:AAA domain-containing protein n=1 Tax=Consotaella salsifontis TaxID=1365950 RepID=A0A1T4SS62_9HYPH|nr:bifunctional DNA primase/polymerase [Consotaella salsifontis]SKA31150.1 AAA domain-containing protein [Consotaella salsifontis]